MLEKIRRFLQRKTSPAKKLSEGHAVCKCMPFIQEEHTVVIDGTNITLPGTVDGVDVSAHAARHKDGGADELDVSELAGAIGSAGEIPETDGAAVSWVEPDGRYTPAIHGAAEHTDLTRYVMIPPWVSTANLGTWGYGIVGAWPDGVDRSYSTFYWRVPADYASGGAFYAVWTSTAAAGNIRIAWGYSYGVCGGLPISVSGTVIQATAGTNQINCTLLSTPAVSAGSLIAFSARRTGTHADDTLDADARYLGAMFVYTANQ